MDIIYTILFIWFMGAVVFFSFIRAEANKQGVEFSPKQLVVAIFWWVWVIWYLCVLVKERKK